MGIDPLASDAADGAGHLLHLADAAVADQGDRRAGTAGSSPISLRCCVPTWNTRLVSFSTLMICLPSSIVSVSGFSQYTSLPACSASMAILRVPVVGRDDRHDVDVLALEQLAVVLVHVDVAAVAALLVLPACRGLPHMVGVHIADGDAVGELHRLRSDAVPAVAGADAAEDRPFVRAGEAEGAGRFAGEPVGENRAGGSGGGGFEEVPAGRLVLGCSCSSLTPWNACRLSFWERAG